MFSWKTNIYYSFFCLVYVVSLLSFITDSIEALKILSCAEYCLVFFLIYKKEKNILHPNILMLIAFFFFLLSKVFFDLVSDRDFAKTSFFTNHTFSFNIQVIMLRSLIVALSGFMTGVVRFSSGSSDFPESIGADKPSVYIDFVFVLLFCGFLAKIFVLAISIKQIFTMGYLSLYLHPPKIPSLLRMMDDLFIPSLALMFVCNPDKTYVKRMNALFIIYVFINLFVGSRGEFIVYGLTYLFFYTKLIKKRVVNLKQVLVPGLIVLAVAIAIGFFRAKSSNFGLADIIVDFFWSAGMSVHVEGYLLENIEKISNGFLYLVMPLISFFLRVFGLHSFPEGGQSRAAAYESYDFPQLLSYLVNKDYYFIGAGLGNSSVAEFYLAGGYCAVFIGFLFYAVLFTGLVNAMTRSKICCFLLYLFVPFYIYTPRWSALYFLSITYLIKFIPFGLIGLFIYQGLLYRQRKPS